MKQSLQSEGIRAEAPHFRSLATRHKRSLQLRLKNCVAGVLARKLIHFAHL